MSDAVPDTDRRTQRDRGMTLPELLICVVVTALIVTVISSALVVTMRQQDNTEGRLNVANAEQSVALWMPADLSSAHSVSTEPDDSPCAGPTLCDGINLATGSSALMVGWFVDASKNPDSSYAGSITNVSYNFYPSTDGHTYELRRIECTAPGVRQPDGTVVATGAFDCFDFVVLRDLPAGPEGAIEATFTPQVTAPWWVITVSNPLTPLAVEEDFDLAAIGACAHDDKNSCRVIVTIDGGGDVEGSGGGLNRISITAGGTTRQEIGAGSLLGAPSFLAAKSRCGGPITLAVDESLSIGSSHNSPNFVKVREAVLGVIVALEGTPVQLQIVTFDGKSRVLGDGDSVPAEAGWHEYFDMTNPTDVSTLKTKVALITPGGAGSGGHTGWEEALFRTFYTPTGGRDVVPETLIFFTDGVPTHGRNSNGFKTAPSTYDGLSATDVRYGYTWPNQSNMYTTAQYHQVAFNRAQAYVGANLGTRVVAVGVGDVDTGSSTWKTSPSSSGTSKPNRLILSQLLTTTDNAEVVRLQSTAEIIDNGTTDMYIPDNWSYLPAALKAVALGQCAGTLTLQTRLVSNPSGHFDQPVMYSPRSVVQDDFTVVEENKRYVETNAQFTARTFDFVFDGAGVDVELVPLPFSNLQGYETDRWECWEAGLGGTLPPDRLLVLADQPNARGFTVRIKANRAVSCTHWVDPAPPPPTTTTISTTVAPAP